MEALNGDARRYCSRHFTPVTVAPQTEAGAVRHSGLPFGELDPSFCDALHQHKVDILQCLDSAFLLFSRRMHDTFERYYAGKLVDIHNNLPETGDEDTNTKQSLCIWRHFGHLKC